MAALPPLAEDVSPAVARLRTGRPDGLVYLGLGVAARAVALAVESEKWDVPVVANSALMFAYGRKDWRAGWDGWVYVDSVSDDNRSALRCARRRRRSAAGPIGVAGYDMGRLVAEAVARAAHLTRAGSKKASNASSSSPPRAAWRARPWDSGTTTTVR